ncbi:restriction endonuclease subunit S [Pseudomonas sp. PA-1-3F]|uniref:restriction endonuclease subunit S n=1 Tax=Pseudomonas sp. PA-1-3F TaxID=2665465 RepID=UPI001F47470A|nr:restriction endonuclease subunit S [Pseudomonas sp. PA-1-3F]MCF5688976.1 restriction endonuclease subunit S [Pseudomonas sp. PA-1-3F]
MSSVNYLDTLLDGAAVEWRALGEVAKKISSGGTPKTGVAEFWEDGTIPWMSSGEVNLETIYKTESFITELGMRNSSAKFVPKKSLVIALAGQGKTRGKVARTRIELTTNQSLASVTVDEKIVNSDYLYHFLKTQYESLRKISSGSGARGGLNLQMISNYKFPIPCPDMPGKSLEIQAEIARILDTFSELTTELTAELTARKQQYSYYRDRLLSFEEKVEVEVEWRALGDIGEFIRGKRFTKADYVEEGISVIHYGEIYTQYGVWADHAFSKVRDDMAGSLRYAEPDDVVIAGVGETVEDVGKAVAWLGTQRVAIHDDSYAFRHSMNPKYISYAMQTASFNSQKTKHVSSGKVKRLLIEGIKKEVLIPVPYPDDPERSLAEQARIVGALDKFDTLTNSMSEGLPREIELRQKQYEHYRDLLLSFPKPEETVA